MKLILHPVLTSFAFNTFVLISLFTGKLQLMLNQTEKWQERREVAIERMSQVSGERCLRF